MPMPSSRDSTKLGIFVTFYLILKLFNWFTNHIGVVISLKLISRDEIVLKIYILPFKRSLIADPCYFVGCKFNPFCGCYLSNVIDISSNFLFNLTVYSYGRVYEVATSYLFFFMFDCIFRKKIMPLNGNMWRVCDID